jgi:hypothetical protein
VASILDAFAGSPPPVGENEKPHLREQFGRRSYPSLKCPQPAGAFRSTRRMGINGKVEHDLAVQAVGRISEEE